MTLDAILFDLDNTLIDRDAALLRYLKAWAPDLSDTDLDAIRAHDCHGYSPRLAFTSWFVREFEPELRARVTGPELWNHMRKNLAEFVRIAPEVHAMLERLRSKTKLGLISNGSSLNQRAKLTRSGFAPYFSSIVISQEAGISKPSEAIFRRALRELDTEPSDAIYVGDHPRADVAGARRAGLRTAWVSLGRTWTDSAAPDIELGSVLELEARVLQS